MISRYGCLMSPIDSADLFSYNDTVIPAPPARNLLDFITHTITLETADLAARHEDALRGRIKSNNLREPTTSRDSCRQLRSSRKLRKFKLRWMPFKIFIVFQFRHHI
ncbi:hypothetical protein J6590_048860 [Homalodisca vitripennis]|nr:hypothetical protein J6590_048860 [Homalodisca vitripennis]